MPFFPFKVFCGPARMRLSLIILLMVVQGCTHYVRDEPAPISERSQDAEQSDSTTRAPADASPSRANSAVQGLVTKAQTASSQGENEKAIALLERAVRIEASNAAVWYNLAIVYYRDSGYRKAEEMAKRSLSLIDAKHDLYERNWHIIAASRRANGDEAGARRAEQQRR